MPVPAELLYAARRYHTSAAASLLESYYPVTYRLAYALSGDTSTAEHIIRLVMKRALSVLPRWRDESLPDRWFYHHTVLAVRTTQARLIHRDPQYDPLIPSVASAPYVAFVRTLRSLPIQQREVIILHYGEHLNERYLGVAMDCSADAASSHLIAATGALSQMCGDRFDALAREMGTVYRILAPSPTAITALRGRVSRYVWPRKLQRWVYRLAMIGILMAVIWMAWHYRHLITQATTAP